MAFNIKKCINDSSDKLDMKRFLTDNYYVGTEDYYREKTGDKLPEHIYSLLELQARETDDKYIEETLNDLKLRYLNVFRTIMKDLEEREHEENKEETEETKEENEEENQPKTPSIY